MFKLFQSNHQSLELGFLIIRLGIGAIFTIFGGMKLMAGPTQWTWLGSQLALLGITVMPVVWGFIAANVEFLGGLCLIFGFCSRLAACLIGVVMSVALVYHFNNNDAYSTYAFALSLLIVMIGIFCAGSGSYSLDYYFYTRS